MSHDFPILLGSGLVLLALFFFGFIGSKIRLPGVILYILLGIILSDLIADNEILHIASEVGIVLLFFLLGMEFPLNKLGAVAKKVWPSGLIDVVLNLGISMLICYLFGLDLLTSFLIGGVVYATSSSITAKLLESTKRMANTESEFVLALLIFEDLIAPIVVAVLLGLTSGGELTAGHFFVLIGKIVALTVVAILIGRFVFAKLKNFVERNSDEDIFIMLVVGIALSYGGLALYLGLSEVLGAFLAGMMIAETTKNHIIERASIPVRDLLLPSFFLYFGTTVSFGEGIPYIRLLIVLIIWSIIAKILVGIIGGRIFGLSKRVALRSGFMLTARGEFSVVIAGLAAETMKPFAGMYILVTAFLGIIFFLAAPKLTTAVYGKKKKSKHKIQVPG